MPEMRASQILWDGVSITQNSVSNAGEIGPMSTVAVMIEASGACTLQIQASAYKGLSSGRNGIDGSLPWFEYVRAIALEIDNGVDAGFSTIVIGGAGNYAVDVSPFAPQFIRLKRTDNGAAATVTAYTVAVG